MLKEGATALFALSLAKHLGVANCFVCIPWSVYHREETWREEFVTTEDMNPVNYLFFGGLVGIRDTQYP